MSQLGEEDVKKLMEQFNVPQSEPLTQVASTILTMLNGSGQDDSNERIDKLRGKFRKLKARCDALLDWNRTVATGLGACECWGTDEDCSRCGGYGAPGFFRPDRQAFSDLVVPLIESRPELFAGVDKDAESPTAANDGQPSPITYQEVRHGDASGRH